MADIYVCETFIYGQFDNGANEKADVLLALKSTFAV